jgi:hypothetical protein
VGEGGDLLVGETVEDEVSNDQVELEVWGRLPCAEVGGFGGKAADVGWGGLSHGLEHGWADVDGVDLDFRLGSEEG